MQEVIARRIAKHTRRRPGINSDPLDGNRSASRIREGEFR
jgi:hypothetical protein